MPLSTATIEAGRALVARYPVARSALLPLLHLVQAEEGHVTDEGVAFCADAVGLTRAEVGAVSTFYTMFRRRDPGTYLLSVCTNPTCNTGGAQQILQRYRDRLGGDRNVELGCEVESAECLGICDAAPMVQVNYEMYGPLTFDEADALLEGCIAGDPPPSNWSGEVPPTFREFEWDIAGCNDGLDDVLAAAARHQASYPNPPAYRTGETDLPVTQPGADPRGVGGTIAGEQGVPSLFDAAAAAAAAVGSGANGSGADGSGAVGSGATREVPRDQPSGGEAAARGDDEPDVAGDSATEGGVPADTVAAERATSQPSEDGPDDGAPDASDVGAAADRTSTGDASADAGADE